MSFIETIRENTQKSKRIEEERRRNEKVEQTEFNERMLSSVKNDIIEYSTKSCKSSYTIEFYSGEHQNFLNSIYYNNNMIRYIKESLIKEGFGIIFDDNDMIVNW